MMLDKLVTAVRCFYLWWSIHLSFVSCVFASFVVQIFFAVWGFPAGLLPIYFLVACFYILPTWTLRSFFYVQQQVHNPIVFRYFRRYLSVPCCAWKVHFHESLGLTTWPTLVSFINVERCRHQLRVSTQLAALPRTTRKSITYLSVLAISFYLRKK